MAPPRSTPLSTALLSTASSSTSTASPIASARPTRPNQARQRNHIGETESAAGMQPTRDSRSQGCEKRSSSPPAATLAGSTFSCPLSDAFKSRGPGLAPVLNSQNDPEFRGRLQAWKRSQSRSSESTGEGVVTVGLAGKSRSWRPAVSRSAANSSIPSDQNSISTSCGTGL